jgi:hypothetical protein
LIASVDLRASDEPTLTRHEPLLKGTDVGDHFSISVPAPAETSPSEESAAADLDQIALRPNPFEATHTYPTGTESDNRNYNFFDELDAQLAGLGEAGSAGDPEESIEKNDQT